MPVCRENIINKNETYIYNSVLHTAISTEGKSETRRHFIAVHLMQLY